MLRAFLLAQLQWERCHALRVGLVHAAAVGGLLLWLVVILPPRVAASLLAPILVGWAALLHGGSLRWNDGVAVAPQPQSVHAGVGERAKRRDLVS